MLSFSSFSQTDTTAVALNKQTANFVIKDLIRGDYCQVELVETRDALFLTEQKVNIQSEVISNLEEQKLLYIDVVKNKSVQISAQDNIIKTQGKLLKKQKTTSTLYKIVAIAGLFTSGILLISK